MCLHPLQFNYILVCSFDAFAGVEERSAELVPDPKSGCSRQDRVSLRDKHHTYVMRLANMARNGTKTFVQSLQRQDLNQHGAAGHWAPAPKNTKVFLQIKTGMHLTHHVTSLGTETDNYTLWSWVVG